MWQGVQGFFNSFFQQGRETSGRKSLRRPEYAHDLTYIDRAYWNTKARDTWHYCDKELIEDLKLLVAGEETKRHVLHFMVSVDSSLFQFSTWVQMAFDVYNLLRI